MFKKPIDYRLKRFDHFIVHCTATNPSMDKIDADWVDHVHKKKGWSGCGYHAVICRDGTLQMHDEGCCTRPLEKTGAHVGGCGRGWNQRSFGVSLAGGLDNDNRPENNFTKAQFATLAKLIDDFKESHPSPLSVSVMGHRDLIKQCNAPAKACPCFDVAEFLDELASNDDDEDALVVDPKSNAADLLNVPKTHEVKSGDSLWAIGQAYGIAVSQIKQINNLDSNTIQPGQILSLETT